MRELICYCFEYSVDDINQDYLENGKSTIMERIQMEKKFGNCQCTTKDPKGKGCLGDIRQVVDKMKGFLEGAIAKDVNCEEDTTKILVQSWAEFGNGISAGVRAGRHIGNHYPTMNVESGRINILNLVNIGVAVHGHEIQVWAAIKQNY